MLRSCVNRLAVPQASRTAAARRWFAGVPTGLYEKNSLAAVQATELSETAAESRLASLTPSLENLGSVVKKRREVGLSAARPRSSALAEATPFEGKVPAINKLTIEHLLGAQVHLGHHRKLWNPMFISYLFGERNGLHVIDLEQTMEHLRRAYRVVSDVAANGGIIVFIGTRPNISRLPAVDAALASGCYYVDSRWIPGTLTNQHHIMSKVQAHSPERAAELQKQHRAALEAAKKTRQRNGPPPFPTVFKPDLLVVLNAPENHVALAEAAQMLIPTVAIVDTDTNPAVATYPIPGNDDAPRSVELIAGLLGQAAHEGALKWKQALAEYQRKPSTASAAAL
ncbi:hypothetical protein GQ42DRAFT_163730 [Ramicandelaber brevisporus]|nr:hypothetical protein GQ42DRAFT_163730 [Ramicandelaber brevisporus]